MAYQASCKRCHRHFIWVLPHRLWVGLRQAVCPVDLTVLHRTSYRDTGRLSGLPPKYRFVDFLGREHDGIKLKN